MSENLHRWDKYLEIPFVDSGRGFSGCDCWGLALLIYRMEFGIVLPDYGISCMDFSGIDQLISENKSAYLKLQVPLQPCLIVIKDVEDPEICNHVGVYIGDRNFLHMLAGMRPAIGKIDHPLWKNRTEGFYVPKLSEAMEI